MTADDQKTNLIHSLTVDLIHICTGVLAASRAGIPIPACLVRDAEVALKARQDLECARLEIKCP